MLLSHSILLSPSVTEYKKSIHIRKMNEAERRFFENISSDDGGGYYSSSDDEEEGLATKKVPPKKEHRSSRVVNALVVAKHEPDPTLPEEEMAPKLSRMENMRKKRPLPFSRKRSGLRLPVTNNVKQKSSHAQQRDGRKAAVPTPSPPRRAATRSSPQPKFAESLTESQVSLTALSSSPFQMETAAIAKDALCRRRTATRSSPNLQAAESLTQSQTSLKSPSPPPFRIETVTIAKDAGRTLYQDPAPFNVTQKKVYKYQQGSSNVINKIATSEKKIKKKKTKGRSRMQTLAEYKREKFLAQHNGLHSLLVERFGDNAVTGSSEFSADPHHPSSLASYSPTHPEAFPIAVYRHVTDDPSSTVLSKVVSTATQAPIPPSNLFSPAPAPYKQQSAMGTMMLPTLQSSFSNLAYMQALPKSSLIMPSGGPSMLSHLEQGCTRSPWNSPDPVLWRQPSFDQSHAEILKPSAGSFAAAGLTPHREAMAMTQLCMQQEKFVHDMQAARLSANLTTRFQRQTSAVHSRSPTKPITTRTIRGFLDPSKVPEGFILPAAIIDEPSPYDIIFGRGKM